MKIIFSLLLVCLLFSCSETKIPETLNGEVWALQSQVIHISDTTYAKGADGNSSPQVSITEFPINNNRDETWTFENQGLEILTKLDNGNETKINFQVENTPEGFILKNNTEPDKVCKITKRTRNEMVLQTGGVIILKRVK